MTEQRNEFLNLALSKGVLKFGKFTLKSGRISPYFFNAGEFNDGASLLQLGQFYAHTIVTANITYDMLYGPAYKGIPLVVATAIALHTTYDINIPYAFNRKEEKDHAEGGLIVGAALAGQVLLLDDVMTAGLAVQESVRIIQDRGAELAGVVVCLDRKERAQHEHSAVEAIASAHNVPVLSIIDLDDLTAHLQQQGSNEQSLAAMRTYCNKYAVGNSSSGAE